MSGVGRFQELLPLRSGDDDLLDGPLVPVGVGEVDEPPPGLVVDRADVDAAALELALGLFDVFDHYLHADDRAGLGVGDSLADADRAGPNREGSAGRIAGLR